MQNVKRRAGEIVNGVQIRSGSSGDCHICPMGKQTKLSFSKQGSRATDILEIVHTEIAGPMEESSLGGSRYYITFIDDKSRRMFVYFLKSKSLDEVMDSFKQLHALAERQTGRRLKTLRSDNGKEYVNGLFQQYLKQAGIRHQTTNDYTPEQNGLAERANRTIVEKARCMLLDGRR